MVSPIRGVGVSVYGDGSCSKTVMGGGRVAKVPMQAQTAAAIVTATCSKEMLGLSGNRTKGRNLPSQT